MFNTLTAFIGSIFSAAKSTKIIAITTVISAIINIIMNIVLIPQYGALGAAIATALAYFMMWLIRLFYLKKIMILRFNFVKNITSYILLVLQVIFEHQADHFYIGQFACICIIVLMYLSEMKIIIEKILIKKKG